MLGLEVPEELEPFFEDVVAQCHQFWGAEAALEFIAIILVIHCVSECTCLKNYGKVEFVYI